MKKGTFILSVLFLIASLILSVSAQELSGIEDKLDTIPKDSDTLKQSSSDFLKQRWKESLQDTSTFGPVIKGYEKISPYTDPVFRYVLGMAPELTWKFILNLFIWITAFIYIFRFTNIFSIYYQPLKYIISIGIIVVLSIFQFTSSIANGIISELSYYFNSIIITIYKNL